MKTCNKCLLSDNVNGIEISDDGQCNMCKLHNKFDDEYKNKEFGEVVTSIKNQSKKYDCLIGVSGGSDSSWLLYQSVKKYGLRPLVIHFDNGWNYPQARKNIDSLIAALGVDYIEHRVNSIEYNKLNLAFLKASVCDADIPNDIAMTKLFWEAAIKNDIKVVFNGHNYKTEGSSPIGWSYMDGAYIQDVYEKIYNRKLVNYPLLSFADQIMYGMKGIKTYRPMYYPDFFNVKNGNLYTRILEENIPGYEGVKIKHGENEYTDFVGSYLLPRKFGIDKRLTYLSALIRSNMISKSAAKNIIETPAVFSSKIENIFGGLNISRQEFEIIMSAPVKPRNIYKSYHQTFKKYKFLILLLVKLNILPYTFYLKYTK